MFFQLKKIIRKSVMECFILLQQQQICRLFTRGTAKKPNLEMVKIKSAGV